MTITIGSPDPAWTGPLVNFAAVLLGGALTWSTTYYFEREKQRDQKLATAYSLLFKVQHYVNEIMQIRDLVGESVAAAERSGATGPLWTKVVEPVGFSEKSIPISPDELSLLARVGDVELTMEVRDLESGHSILRSALDRMFALRRELRDAQPGSSADGRTISFEVDEKSYPGVAPTLINLADLSTHLESAIPRIASQAIKTGNQLGPALKRHYKFGHFIALSFDSEEEQSA
jgi:hypothetical protein